MDNVDFNSELLVLIWTLARKFPNADPDEVEDSAMVALERGWKELGLGEREPFRTAHLWLYEVARNMVIDVLRHKSIEPRLETTMDVAMGPEDVLRFERDETIAQLVGLVKEDFREVFILRAVEGRTLKEVATLTGLEPKTISQRVQRLIVMLHEMMSEEINHTAHDTRHTAHGTRHVTNQGNQKIILITCRILDELNVLLMWA